MGFPLVSWFLSVANSTVGPVSTGPLFEATTTFAANIHQFGGVPSRPVSSHMASLVPRPLPPKSGLVLTVCACA